MRRLRNTFEHELLPLHIIEGASQFDEILSESWLYDFQSSFDIDIGPKFNLGDLAERKDFGFDNFNPNSDFQFKPLFTDDYSDDIYTTGVVNFNGTTSGVFEVNRDIDWFRMDMVVGTSYRLFLPIWKHVRYAYPNGEGESGLSNLSYVTETDRYSITRTFQTEIDQTIFLALVSGNDVATYPFEYSFESITFDTPIDDHSNRLDDTATEIEIGDILSGQIYEYTDRDVFRMYFDAGMRYQFTSEPGVFFDLYNWEGNTVNSTGNYERYTDPETGNEVLAFTPADYGRHYLQVRSTNSSADFPLDFSISSSETNPFTHFDDDSGSTLNSPDQYELGSLLNGEGNFGSFPDHDYYSFTVSADATYLFESLQTDRGHLIFSIIDENGNTLEPGYENLYEFNAPELDYVARVYHFEDGETYRLITRGASYDSQNSTFEILSIQIPDFTTPEAYVVHLFLDENFQPWAEMPDPGPSPDPAIILDRVVLSEGTYVVAEGQINSSFSCYRNTVVDNHGLIWSSGRTIAVTGDDWAGLNNYGTLVSIDYTSAVGCRGDRYGRLNNEGEIYVAASAGYAHGFTTNASYAGDGLYTAVNDGLIEVWCGYGKAEGMVLGRNAAVHNAGTINVTGWTDSHGLRFLFTGSVINEGTITVTTGSRFSTSYGIYAIDGPLINIENSGTIEADVAVYKEGAISLYNTGLIIGDIRTDATGLHGGNSVVINSGTINGDIHFKHFADTIDTVGGTINGTVYLGSGGDVFMGGSGKDRVFGENGDDTLSGGAGADYINGGSGNDLITGGTGADIFWFDGNSGHDRISDFEVGIDQVVIAGSFQKFEDLVFVQSGDNLILKMGAGTITFENMTVGQLTAEDFSYRLVQTDQDINHGHDPDGSWQTTVDDQTVEALVSLPQVHPIQHSYVGNAIADNALADYFEFLFDLDNFHLY